MWIVGLLLLAAAVVVGIEFGISSDQQVDVETFNHVWTSSPAAAFLAGIVATVVSAFGLWLMITGMRRSRVRRRDRRAEMAERDRLADERRREIEAMSTARGDDQHADDDRTMTADARDRDRERVPADRRDDVDLRDDRDDAIKQHEAEHHAERGGILHRSRH